MAGGKAPAHMSPLVKLGAGLALLLLLLVCTAIANGAKKRTRSSAKARLDLTSKRAENCDLEIRMLNGEKLTISQEIQLAQDESAHLSSEIELLKEEKEQLSKDVADLERTVDDLKEELDDKDFISDDEAQALEETLALGNNSQALAGLLESASFSDETDIVVGKDELIKLLLTELKLKRTALATCMAAKKVVGKFDQQILWQDMTDQQKSATLRAQVKKIALLQATNPREAEALIQKWAPRHYRGDLGLREDVAKRAERKAEEKERRHEEARAEEGEDGDDGDWDEWDWDAEDEDGRR